MLGLFGNLSFSELLVIAVIAVLIFGERLPQAAARAYREMTRLRRQLDDLRRESGIDKEFREIKRTFRDVADSARVQDPRVQGPRVQDPRNQVVPRTPDYQIQDEGGERDPAAGATARFPDYLLEGQEREQRLKDELAQQEEAGEPVAEGEDEPADQPADERDAG